MIVEEYSRSEESIAVLRRRGWRDTDDQSVPMLGRRLVRKTQRDTPLIRLLIEEFEYGVGGEYERK